jgi:hypothetical protein
MNYRVGFVGELTDAVRGELSAAGIALVPHQQSSGAFPTGPFSGPDHNSVVVDAPTAAEAVALVRGVVEPHGAYTVFDDAEPVQP